MPGIEGILSEEALVAGIEKKLKPEAEKVIGDAGKVIEAIAYAPAKGGGFAVVLDTEYAALKLHYHYRYSNAHLVHNERGWIVSVYTTN